VSDLPSARPAKVPHRLERVAFRTPRFIDFVGQRELTAQIGHPPEHWPITTLKELVVLDMTVSGSDRSRPGYCRYAPASAARNRPSA